MSSGSLKDVVKAINSIVPQSEPPIPDQAQAAIQAYLDKHTPIEESDSNKLQDELIPIWQKLVKDKPERYPIFLNILRELRPAIRGEARWLQWWDALVIPVLGHMSQEKGLASGCRKLLLAIMIFEPEDKDTVRIESAKATSKAIAEKILEMWLKKSGIATADANPIAKYMEEQIKIVLLELGRRKPQELFNVLNKYFVQARYRNQITTLLVALLSQDAPHLHVMKETPLFDSLLRCLQIDTSTTVITQAMTALTMFLPHIPVSSGGYLPALFNIYTRMLLWEKYKDPSAHQEQGSDDGEDIPAEPDKGKPTVAWEKLEYSGDLSDETLPDILHYFTFLYGLYPYNLMAYIRKPSRWRKEWVKADKHLGGYEIEVEPHEIQHRSKPYQSQHLLHPHFLSHTEVTEITDAERWRQHAASDVATFCMELLQPLADDTTQPPTPSLNQHQEFSRTLELKRSERGLLTRSSSHETFHTHRSHDNSREGITSNPVSGYSSRHMSAVVLPDGTGDFSQLSKLSSRNSQSAASSADVVSPGTANENAPRPDAATSPGPTEAVASLEGMLASQHSVRSNLRHSIRNDSSTTLSSFADTSHHGNANVDTYLASLPSQTLALHQQPPRSPSLRPTTTQNDQQSTIASLQRDVTLLQNALSFERYLKQQHFSHIGKLRRQAIREAVAESETQNLLNDNRKLKLEVKKEKDATAKIRKEADLSRAQSRKWEHDVTTKLRAIKEEQKKWLVEKDLMKAEMETLRADNEGMKALIIQSEEREHQTSRKLKGIEIELEALERLRAERDKLKARLRKFLQEEKGEEEKAAERERQESKIGLLGMMLNVKERELDEARLANTEEIETLKIQMEEAGAKARKEATNNVQQIIDAALDASRKRAEADKKYRAHLRVRIAGLEGEVINLKQQLNRDTLEAMRSKSIASDPLSPLRQQARAINMNPLEPYVLNENTVALENTVSFGDGAADAVAPRPMMAKTQSTPAMGFKVPRFDAHSLSMAGGGGRVLTDAAPTPTRPRDDRRMTMGPVMTAGVMQAHGLTPAAIGMGSQSADAGPSNGRERAKSPKPKTGDRSGLMFGRGRSIYDSLF